MPLMTDLLSRLQDAPPQTEMELRSILEETGYDLIMKEPSMEEIPLEDDAVEEEVMEEEEAPEDMGPEEVEVEEAVDLPEDPMVMMENLMPPGIGAPHSNEAPRMKVRRMTMVAAHKAMPKDKKGGSNG